MSVFNWFSRKLFLGLRRGEPGEAGQTARAARREPAQGTRRSERSERREQLYSVVRDVMVRAGVLSASYKFKVLSLDSAGQRFVVMMDLARAYAGETARLSEIEAMLAQAAKARMGAVVSAVYWRISDQIGVAPQAQPAATARGALAPRAPDPGMALPAAPLAAAMPPQRRRQDAVPYEPIDAQEMAAFKQAVAAAPHQGAGRSTPQEAAAVRRSGPLLGPGAADRPSEFPHSEMGHFDLGVTQYGELR